MGIISLLTTVLVFMTLNIVIHQSTAFPWPWMYADNNAWQQPNYPNSNYANSYNKWAQTLNWFKGYTFPRVTQVGSEVKGARMLGLQPFPGFKPPQAVKQTTAASTKTLISNDDVDCGRKLAGESCSASCGCLAGPSSCIRNMCYMF